MKNLFRWLSASRRRETVAKADHWPDGPDPLVLTSTDLQPNPILSLLEDWRLPCRETRSQVIERVGISEDPFYHGDTILLPEATQLPGAMSAWSASAFKGIPPQFPISRFSAMVWVDDDAQDNLLRTVDHLSQNLESAPAGQRWNTFVATWRCGRAEINLMSFPPEWQSGNLQNDAHDREPRLRTACRVDVATGFVLPPNDEEQAWIESFRPVNVEGSVGTAREAQVGAQAPFETELEYVRDASNLATGFQATIGLAENDEALMIVSSQLYILPRQKLLAFDVSRLTPAKGGGGSTLHARCQTEAPGTESRSVFVAQSPDPDGMNDLAEMLGRRLGCPVAISPYCPDI